MGKVLLFKRKEKEVKVLLQLPEDFDPMFPGEEVVDGEVVTFSGSC